MTSRAWYVAGGAAGACSLLGFVWLARSSARPRLESGSLPRHESSSTDEPTAAALAVPPLAGDRAPGRGEALVQAPASLGDGAPGADPLLIAQNELARQVDDSLEGYLYINHLLDQVQAFADLPVDPRVDLEYDDDDAIAFEILAMPAGTTGHFLVGRKTFERNGEEFRFLQMEIEMGEDESPTYHRDSLRYGPRIHLTIDYDGSGTPYALALILQRDVALRESRQRGIDAYRGTYTTGAGYRVNLPDPERSYSGTFGLVDGTTARADRFPGPSPLVGDTRIDPERVRALFEALMSKRAAVNGSFSEAR